ncbi:MAG: tripartite tricarboxylate transporter substrate binding protein [Alphaproteobacteria bacterium]
MTPVTRRAALFTALATPALAQGAWRPERPIRLIVPWTAGGPADTHFRALAEVATRGFGQPVVVENRPGATGTLGATTLKEARPDGLVVSQMPPGVFRVPLLSPRPAYDPMTDFTWIIQLTGSVFGTVVRADSPWQSLGDLLAYARANPGKVNYGTLGIASSQHLGMERIAAQAGVIWTHVPYRGTSETLTALISGHIDAAGESSSWAPMVEEGRLRLLATWGSARPPRFANVPTLTELGIPIVVEAQYGLAGPRGMDPGVVQALHDGFRVALFNPAHLAALERFHQRPLYLNSADYTLAVREQFETEREALRRIGMLPS